MLPTTTNKLRKLTSLFEYLFNSAYLLSGYEDNNEDKILRFLKDEVKDFLITNDMLRLELVSLSQLNYYKLLDEIWHYTTNTFSSLNYKDEDLRIKAYYLLTNSLGLKEICQIACKLEKDNVFSYY